MMKRNMVGCALLCLCARCALADEAGVVTGERVLDMFLKGGYLMWPILLCSVVALAVVLERLVTLRRGAVFPRRFHDAVAASMSAGRVDQALAQCRDNRSPFARLLESCLLRAEATGFEMEAALEEAGARVLYDLRNNNRPLGVIGEVAPLLGLMGTVLGMIKAFEVVARTGTLGRAELLAEGISEALLTTAFGLSVAIPAIIFYQYFRSKADGLLRAMEDACVGMMTDLRTHRRSR
jgi:biopolymer transport protein ExbB